ncbi:MAG: hypothetical protein R3E83_19340 [Burkholderiaceae bacterium]
MPSTFDADHWRDRIRNEGIASIERERPHLDRRSGPAADAAIREYWRREQAAADARREHREEKTIAAAVNGNRIALLTAVAAIASAIAAWVKHG